MNGLDQLHLGLDLSASHLRLRLPARVALELQCKGFRVAECMHSVRRSLAIFDCSTAAPTWSTVV